MCIFPLIINNKLKQVNCFQVNSVRLQKHVSDKRYFCGTVLIEFSKEEDANKILNETLIFAGAELTLKPKYVVLFFLQ
jgi:lupus La protein